MMLSSLRTLVADLLRPVPLGRRPLEPPSIPDHAILWEYRKSGVYGQLVCYSPPSAPCRQNEDQVCIIAEHMNHADTESIYEGCEQPRVLATTAVTPVWQGDYYDWTWS